MSIIINAIRQGQRDFALTLILTALPYQLCQYDQYGQTALHLAIQKNYLDIAKALLEKGANINALASDPSYTHMTPLHYAALTGNISATRLLLAWGANPLLENGQFHLASTIAHQHGFSEIAKTIERHSKNRTAMKQVLSQKFELHVSAADTLYNRTWETKKAKGDNIVDFAAYRKKAKAKNKKKPTKLKK